MLSNKRRAEADDGFSKGYGATASISARHPRRRADATRPENSHRQPQASHVALACDWLTTPGGAEKVLLELHHMYPDAPIYTSQYRPKKITWFADADVRTGWLQPFPAALRKVLGPLRQLYFSRLDLSRYDLVISVTGAEAKSIRTAPKKTLSSNYSTHIDKSQGETAKSAPNPNPDSKSKPQNIPPASAKHLCYCHVPTQYYWQLYDKYIENPGFGPLNPLIRLCFKLLVKPLRKADYAAAQRPDQFITISDYAAAQIKKYYNRDAVIISPPVETSKFRPSADSSSIASSSPLSDSSDIKNSDRPLKSPNFSTRNRELSTENPELFHNFSTTNPQVFHSPYFIIACRQVTWKRVDLAISACLEAKAPLLVVGDGPEHKNLLKIAENSPLIKFLPWIDSSELASYLQHARAYLFPSLEPFGIAAVEALAAGCPVIAYSEGGSRDFITPGKNGLLFDSQTSKSLAAAIEDFSKYTFDRTTITASSFAFDASVFRKKIQALVDSTLAPAQPSRKDSHA